jgi:hypothetical protein
VLAHRRDLFDGRGAGQYLGAPADRADALREHPYEAAVRVDDRETGGRGGGRRPHAFLGGRAEALERFHCNASLKRDRSENPLHDVVSQDFHIADTRV